jgi:hypothetical protein
VAEVSDVFVVRGSLQLLEATPEFVSNTSVELFAAGGASVTWTSDGDYKITGVMPVSGSVQCCLSTDNTSYTTNFSASGNLKKGSVIFLGGTSSSQSILPVNWDISKNQKLFFTNNSASNCAVILYLAART